MQIGVRMKKLDLCGNWFMNKRGEVDQTEAKIPGSVMSSLLRAGKIEDPFYRMNEYDANQLFYNDYEFVKKFEVGELFLQEKRIELVCEGLDTLCELYINQKKIADTDNMHCIWVFDLKDYLTVGENEIKVLCKSVHEYKDHVVDPEGKEITFAACGCMKGNQYIRKPHCMFGWDWGAGIPDAGIWKDIYVRSYSNGRIDDVIFTQIHETNKVTLEMEVMLENSGPMEKKVIAVLLGPDGKKFTAVGKTDAERANLKIEVEQPMLWWPNELGEQPLYKCKIFACEEEKEYTIGLRTLEVSQEKDEWGSDFCFKVNGVKIFSMGADYIPEDTIYSHISRERIDYLLKSCKRAHFNTLRVWGGGYYPSDDFYELCDQYGFIVWQDFMFACNIYNVTDEFVKAVCHEVKDNVKRLRHHASLGMWCGNNEIEEGWHHWESMMYHSDLLKQDYLKLFEDILPKVLREVDKQTFYWPSSPSSLGGFVDPDNENVGDTHYWDVWHGLKPFTDYRKHYFRFCSEFGFQSFPSIKTVESFTEEEDRNIFSEVMESHQKNDAANGKMLYYLSENFLYPKDFKSLLYVTQILQGIAIKAGVEHWRRHRGRCMGALYWQLNDSWPVASWASIDYYGRWKALHYMAEDFFAPVAGSIERTGQTVKVFVQNESKISRKCNATVRVKTFDFEILKEISFQKEVQAFSVCELGGDDFTSIIKGKETQVFLEAVFTDDSGRKTIEVETFVPFKHLKLKNIEITTSVVEKEDCFEISVKSKGFAAFVEIDLQHNDGIFSDNYFYLTDQEEKKVQLYKSDLSKPINNIQELQKEITIRSLAETY
ncbi:MAG: glycoside hydrolase family 2 protein [Lachnospiraceae bacterium]|nr:glycoside hydrolase family 2 protein [Lachnospiraceae bacterium]